MSWSFLPSLLSRVWAPISVYVFYVNVDTNWITYFRESGHLFAVSQSTYFLVNLGTYLP